MTNEEQERAVERLEAAIARYPREPRLRTDKADLRALLSERAELLAAVERMRGALEQAELDAVFMERERAFWRSLKPKGGKNVADCKTDYERELYRLWQYEVRQRDTWRGIASAMGYEPKAHDKVKPTQAWLIERVAMFRARAALATATEQGERG